MEFEFRNLAVTSDRRTKKIGARGRNLVEQTVIVKEFTAQWFRPEIDLCELAKLREDGWKVKDIASHFGASKTGVLDRLKALGFPSTRA